MIVIIATGTTGGQVVAVGDVRGVAANKNSSRCCKARTSSDRDKQKCPNVSDHGDYHILL